MSIEVGWQMVMRIKHQMARDLWVHLMEVTDADQLAVVGIKALVAKGADRSALWRALKDLADLNLIRKRDDSWNEVWINPRAVHPFGLKGRPLEEKIQAFEEGTLEIKKKSLNRKEGE